MQLDIYNISHPIIKILSNITKQKKPDAITSLYCYKNIGLLIIYEVLRKYVVIKPVYIKSLHSTKLLNLIDRNKKYIILTNFYDNYEMITDIKILLPNIDIIDISNNNKDNSQIETKHIGENTKTTEIIILTKELSNIKVLALIKYLTLEEEIPPYNIKIACIIAYEDVLTNLSYEHPDIKIYTTEIGHN
uniref:Uracil phosphoribosyltransferase n=1 Tax=Chondria sp. (in: red algae) TaxID=1982705 RepID=A0A1Z1MCL4_9FLOR|nr:uracil phosphoribosyltransferase [Chondria sp. (in: red algae)]